MTEKLTKEEAIADLAVAVVCVVPILLFYGFGLSCMWGWFVVPMGVPAIGTLQAAGCGVLLHRVCGHVVPTKPGDRAAAGVLTALFRTGFMLLVGWAIHGFM